jgi:sigma-B regulation protein RsbU (phosphoserine phosphatase)
MQKKIKLNAEVKYNLLKEISFKLKNTLDLEKILNQLLDSLGTIINYDAAGIFVLGSTLVHSQFRVSKQVITGIASRGFDPGPIEEDEMLTQGKGIIGYVIKTGEYVVISDVRPDDRYVAGRQTTLSEMALPIFIDDQPIGALNVESDRLDAYNTDDLEVLRFFAGAAAISIEKTLLHLQILEKEKIEKQLQLAAEVQSRLLPNRPPVVEGYDIAGLCLPTYAIGGDYFDYIGINGDNLAIVVADVSGSGIPAALLMTSFRTLLHTSARTQKNPLDVMNLLNGQISEFTAKKDFITVLYGILNHQNHSFTYVNCGHNPPFILKGSGQIEELRRGGPSLNIQEEPKYETNEVLLKPGDNLILYTDGAIEIFNQENTEFGIDRLIRSVQDSASLSSEAIIKNVVKATKHFHGSDIYQDDFTLVIVKRKS